MSPCPPSLPQNTKKQKQKQKKKKKKKVGNPGEMAASKITIRKSEKEEK